MTDDKPASEEPKPPPPESDPKVESTDEASSEVPDRTIIADLEDQATPAEPEPESADRTVITEAPSAPPMTPAADPTVLSDTRETASATVRLVEPGTLINNNYRIIELISAGGMGEVYRAENVFTGDPVAIKVILANLANDESVLDLFRREARVLVQLRDDAIVRYHNFILDGGLQRYCLIMEYVQGRHLGTRVKEDGALADAALLALTDRLASGLLRAHTRGVTHRDLSPDNVILRDDRIEEAVLIDFGIARSTELGDGLAGRFAGKFKYIAPEQLGHWQGVIGPRTDVYGLGLLIAMLARGKPLDMGDSVVSASAARQAIPPLDGVSHRLFPMLQHMLEPDPANRPEDMAAVLRILKDPQQLPAQYRLPMWITPVEGGATADPDGVSAHGLSQTGSLHPKTGSLTGHGGEELTGSHSPFASILAAPASSMPIEPENKGRSWGLIAGTAVLLLALAGGGVWWSQRAPDAPVEPDPSTATATSTDMQPRDIATREGFLAEQVLPPCSFATRLNHGPNAGQISLLGNAAVDTSRLIDGYEGAFGVRPSVIEQRVTDAQCPVMDFLRDVAGRPAAPPVLGATVTTSPTGFQLQGRVQLDDGAPDRGLWLFLVSPAGGVYDLTGQLQDGDSRTFGVSIQPEDSGTTAGQTYMLVAVTSANPLATVVAAPAAAPAQDLLPLVLDELRQNADAPAADVFVFSSETNSSI